MKRFIPYLLLFQIAFLNAQDNKGIFGNSNWFKSWTNFKPKTTDYREATEILYGSIDKDRVLSKNQIYLLRGNVYVTNEATLTIEPGTLIRGDFSSNGCLIVTKGSKIIAQGEEANPIIFTSNKPDSERKAGDWGGIVIMGDAPINKFTGQLDYDFDPNLNRYGGSNPESNSGILKYVRIEFAGKKDKNNKKLNSLCLAGIGKKTVIEYVQVSFSGSNSYQFNGGETGTTNLISYKSIDDDFSFSEGVQCKINNSIVIRNSFVCGPNGSRAIEVDSYDVASNVDLSKKITTVEADYLTIINDNNTSNNVENEAIYLREKTNFKIKNSVISGFKRGVVFANKIIENTNEIDLFEFQNILFNNCDNQFTTGNREYFSIVENWTTTSKVSYEKNTVEDSKLFSNVDLKNTPDYRIAPSTVVANKQ
ncbi:MAG: hypothetical protein QM535_16805 [Limnohabitans sp.]|nr:hypothetical protein [Limnohabitans sp.]